MEENLRRANAHLQRRPDDLSSPPDHLACDRRRVALRAGALRAIRSKRGEAFQE